MESTHEFLMSPVAAESRNSYYGQAYDLAIQRASGTIVCGHLVETPRGSSSIDLPNEYTFHAFFPPEISSLNVTVIGEEQGSLMDYSADRVKIVEAIADKAFRVLQVMRAASTA